MHLIRRMPTSRTHTSATRAWAAALALATAALAGCGDSPSESAKDTIALGDGVGSLEAGAAPDPGGEPSGTPVVASTCAATVSGDIDETFVSPSAVALVRTDKWLSLEQVAAAGFDADHPERAPLDGWINVSCTLPNGDTVTARTADETSVDQIPFSPSTNIVTPGVPTASTDPDPSGVASFVVLATVDGALFAPNEGGTVSVTTYDGGNLSLTVQTFLTEVEPLGQPRVIAIDATFSASCGAPYEGCGS